MDTIYMNTIDSIDEEISLSSFTDTPPNQAALPETFPVFYYLCIIGGICIIAILAVIYQCYG
jgi:hypothetical protein